MQHVKSASRRFFCIWKASIPMGGMNKLTMAMR